jgi:ppGpp synthetase/RelA/SpoT-type nucleotidyltranferase
MKADRDALRIEFEKHSALYKSLSEEAFYALESALAQEGIKYHSIPFRIKKVGSFLDKADRKELDKPFEQITDIVGLRVVCLFLSDIPRVGDVIRRVFEVVSEDNKLEDQQVSSVGYFSVHFIARMKKEYSGPRYDPIAGAAFEIQVRTIAMDAWANVSHYLEYKTEEDIPKGLKRDFYALSGLFYVADTHFEMLFKSREASRAQMSHEFVAKTADFGQDINLDTFTSYLRARYPDRRSSDEKSVSELIQELAKTGYKTIGQVDAAVNQTWNVFQQYEKEHPPAKIDPPGPRRFADVGVIRISLCIFDPKFQAASFHSENVLFERYRKLLEKSTE